MKQAKHTKGPWRCESGMVMKDDIPIAYMDREPGNGTVPVERDCNARLIASAPEMLEACEAFMVTKIEASGVTHVEMDAVVAAELTDKVANAIKKATGA